jgi:hypothetical protein
MIAALFRPYEKFYYREHGIKATAVTNNSAYEHIYRREINFLLPSLLQNGTPSFTTNVVVEWLTPLRIQEVPGSNLGPGTGYP